MATSQRARSQQAEGAPGRERCSVTFVPAAVRAVQELMEVSRLSKADAINRAVQVYAFLAKEMADGSQILLRSGDGSLERVHIV